MDSGVLDHFEPLGVKTYSFKRRPAFHACRVTVVNGGPPVLFMLIVNGAVAPVALVLRIAE